MLGGFYFKVLTEKFLQPSAKIPFLVCFLARKRLSVVNSLAFSVSRL